ncbi:ABC transporter ATP-binding protein [Aureisphaera galaxeae]|uniref:ABC transporter transmembrane domain-containing protein n=1 Tax=Aureisphaera galaxeae TaxID=1538023 RepID=UPI00234FE787|nr:ABC transporter ATP-binding protein [Aureisphaera galaxeae]MDC8005272.1 ABC transporter ATP-binding protein [Aureisphaera galaxeae]
MGRNDLILPFIRQHKWRFLATIIVGMVANIFVVLIPVSLGKFFDLLFQFQSHRAAFLDLLPFSFWGTVPEYLWFLFAMILILLVFQFLKRYQTAILGELYVKQLRERLYQQQLKIESLVYDNRGAGRYLLRHSGDLKTIQNYLTKGIVGFLTDIILILIALLFLLWLNKTIFLIILIGFVATSLSVFLLNKILFKVSVERRNTRSGLLAFVSRQLNAVNAIKAFNKDSTEIGKYNKRSAHLYDAGKSFQGIYNFILVAIPAMLYLVLLSVLYVVYVQKTNNSLTIDQGEIIGFLLLFITILPIFRRVIRVSSVWELGNISFKKLINVFELPIEKNNGDRPAYQYDKGHIEFKKVTFGYTDEEPLFSNLDFTIQPKKANQIKIGNGEGKSTLLKLIAGIYKPDLGDILFDGQAMNNLDLRSIRKKVTFVSDELELIGRTVFEVVSYSRKESKLSKTEELLEQLQRDVPNSLKLDVKDKVVEGGKNLSKSQIKLLHYTRAILSNKPIIIIDEPIRNMEKNTKRNIMEWLASQKGEKTLVFLCRTWKESTIEIDHVITLSQ